MDIPRFDVTVAREGLDLEKALDAGEYDTYRAVILHADQLVAEQSGPRFALPPLDRGTSMVWATLWCYYALRRGGVDLPEFPLWKVRVISMDRVKDPEPEGVSEGDPTRPDPDTDLPLPWDGYGPASIGLPPRTD